jgi:uncharacterized protein (TIGR02246 family)
MQDLATAAEAIAAEWQAAWNAHDMSRIGALITADADWITVGGRHLRGAAEVQSVHHTLHESALRHTVWANHSVDAQPIGADAALLHLAWAVSGETDANGTLRPPRKGLFTWVLVRDAQGWRIRAAQGTNVVP